MPGLVIVLGFLAATEPGIPQGPPVDGDLLTCRVTDSRFHQPVVGAVVFLIDPEGRRETLEGRTGTSGHAAFRAEGDGPFIATAQHELYVPVRLDGTYPFHGAQLVRRDAGERTGCQIILRHRSSLSGFVRNRDGHPIATAAVAVLRRTYHSGGPSYSFAATSTTEQDGSFALRGLLPGQYLLRAVPPKPAEGDNGGHYATAFYPSAPDPSAASIVNLSEGMSTSGLDILVDEARLVNLHLQVASSKNALAGREVTVMRGINDLTRLEYSAGCCSRQRLDDDNRLVLRDIPPGTYTFKVEDGDEEGSITLTLGSAAEAFAEVVLAGRRDLIFKVVRGRTAKAVAQEPRIPLIVSLIPVADMTIAGASGAVDTNDEILIKEVKQGAYRSIVAGLGEEQYAGIWVNGREVSRRPVCGPGITRWHW